MQMNLHQLIPVLFKDTFPLLFVLSSPFPSSPNYVYQKNWEFMILLFSFYNIILISLLLFYQLPSLAPERFSMTGLNLLQHLYRMFKTTAVKPCDSAKVNILI